MTLHGQSDSGPIAHIEFPPEWETAQGWKLIEVYRTLDLPDGKGVIAGGVLTDGSNLLGMAFPGGQRLLRIAADTGWAVEERFDGRELTDEDAMLKRVWQITVDSSVDALKMAERDMGGKP